MILLTIICVLLFALSGYLGFMIYQLTRKNASLQETVTEYTAALQDANRAVELALKYEEFYNLTIGDVGETLDALNVLIAKRQLLSDDPDIQNVVKLLAIAHDTLLGYANAKTPAEEKDRDTIDTKKDN